VVHEEVKRVETKETASIVTGAENSEHHESHWDNVTLSDSEHEVENEEKKIWWLS
jgi:hypothetical protein